MEGVSWGKEVVVEEGRGNWYEYLPESAILSSCLLSTVRVLELLGLRSRGLNNLSKIQQTIQYPNVYDGRSEREIRRKASEWKAGNK